MKPRNPLPAVAQFRNSAGTMHDKRAPRGGSTNTMREYLDEYDLESESEDNSQSESL